MELRYRREAAVGLLLVVATVLFIFGLIWLRGRSLRSGELISTAFDDVSGLKVGDPVRTAGVYVGQVHDIALDTRGRVVVTIKLTVHQPPRKDASATIRALDFFGAEYVDYDPGRSAQFLPARDTIPGERQADLSQLAQSFSAPGQQALANVAAFVGPENARELRSLLAETRAAVGQLGAAVQAPSQQAAQAMTALRDVLQRLDVILGSDTTAEMRDNLRSATRSIAQAATTLQQSSATLDSILVKINTGRGSLGRIVNDTTLVTDLHTTSRALTDLLVDLKANPGRYVTVRVF